MPGVDVTTSIRSGPANDSAVAEATYFAAGQAERGPIDRAVTVRSLAEFAATFGDRVTYGALWDDVRMHFEEGGVRAVIARVTGPARTFGTLTLKDRSTAPGLDTFRVDAQGPGAHSTRLTVEVQDGAVANTYSLIVRYDGAIVEAFRDLATPAAGASALQASVWVRGTDLGSATASPNNNPKVLAATALSAGADDRASITATHYTTALALFGSKYGTGAVAIPGQPASAVGVGLAAHAAAFHRLALTAVAIGSTAADAKTAEATLAAGITTDEYVGLFYPGVKVPDGLGGTRTITPEGYVAAARARAVLGYGPWRAPGGALSAARFIVAPEVEIDRTAGDDLDANHVSAIRTIAGGVRLYGWRSLSTDDANWHSLTGRDVCNGIQEAALAVAEEFVFETIDAGGYLLSRLNSALTGIVEPIARAGGLYPRDDDPGYLVDTGASVNTDALLAANQIGAVVEVRPSPTAELIKLSIVKAAVTAAL